MAEKLSPKQKRFCEEYLIDLNGTQSAIRAGYSKKTARKIASENLTKLDIQEEIQRLMNIRSERTEITTDKVLKELADIAFDDIKNYLNFKMNEEGQIDLMIKDSDTINTKNISEISLGKDGQFKFKLYCKDTALVNVGKHLGMFTDKIEYSGNLGVTIIDDITYIEEEDEEHGE